MTCPTCNTELEPFSLTWMAGGPPPKQGSRCKGCQHTFALFAVLGEDDLLINPSEKPPGYPMSEFIADKLAERRRQRTTN